MQNVLGKIRASCLGLNVDTAKHGFPFFLKTYDGWQTTLSDVHRAWLLWYTVFVRKQCIEKWNAQLDEIRGLTKLMNKLMAPREDTKASWIQRQAFIWDLHGDPDDSDNAIDRVFTDLIPCLRDMDVTPLQTSEIYDDFCNLSEPEMLYLYSRLFGSGVLRCEYERLSRPS